MKQIIIQDTGRDKYSVYSSNYILGRMYDNLAEEVQVIVPKCEQNSHCTLIATTINGTVLDHIDVTSGSFKVRKILSKNEKVLIGFYFSKQVANESEEYSKSSEIKEFIFLKAQDPDKNVAEITEQAIGIDEVLRNTVTEVGAENNNLYFKNKSGTTIFSYDVSKLVGGGSITNIQINGKDLDVVNKTVNINLSDYSNINHNHDELYSKLDHSHDFSDLYANINHNHNDTYLKLSGGTITGNIEWKSGQTDKWLLPYLLAFKNADVSQTPQYPYTGFYQWGDEWQVNARDSSNTFVHNILTINNKTKVATFTERPTVNGSNIMLQSDTLPITSIKNSAGNTIISTKTLNTQSHTGWTGNSADDRIIPTMSFMAYWNGAYSSSGASNLKKCANGDIIGTTGDQLFTGVKRSTVNFGRKITSHSKGVRPASTSWSQINFQGNNNVVFGGLENGYGTTENRINLIVYQPFTTDTNTNARLSVGFSITSPAYATFTSVDQYVNYYVTDNNSNYILVTADNKNSLGITAGTTPCYQQTAFTYAPSPASGSNTTEIATTAWVRSLLSGGTVSSIKLGGTLNADNRDITAVNQLSFADPGVNEGLYWAGGNQWKIYESPNDLSNAAGNLQFVTNTTRRMTLDTSGNLYVTGTLYIG